jgi:hypothetical protein
MKIDDLNEIITLLLDGAQWAEAFRRKRVRLLVSEDSPINLAKGCYLFVHLIPHNRQPINFRDSKYIDAIKQHGRMEEITRHGYNSDGHIRFGLSANDKIDNYLLYMRSGLIEYCTIYESNGLKMLPGTLMDTKLLFEIEDGLSLLEEIGQSYPISILVSLIGCQGLTIAGQRYSKPIDRNQIWGEGLVLEKKPESYHNSIIRLLDTLWNSSGLDYSPNVAYK